MKGRLGGSDLPFSSWLLKGRKVRVDSCDGAWSFRLRKDQVSLYVYDQFHEF